MDYEAPQTNVKPTSTQPNNDKPKIKKEDSTNNGKDSTYHGKEETHTQVSIKQDKPRPNYEQLNAHLSTYRSNDNNNSSYNNNVNNTGYHPSSYSSTNHTSNNFNNFNKLTLRNEPYQPTSSYSLPYNSGDYTNYNTSTIYSKNSDYSNHQVQNNDITSMDTSSTYGYIK